jgi:hypothetical protein
MTIGTGGIRDRKDAHAIQAEEAALSCDGSPLQQRSQYGQWWPVTWLATRS